MFHRNGMNDYKRLCMIIHKRLLCCSRGLERCVKNSAKMTQGIGLRDKKNVYSMPPSLVRVTVIGCGRKGTPRALCLEARNKLYLFNCGEGTQKVMMQSKTTHMFNIDHIFVTHLSWANIGGIYAKCFNKKMKFDETGETVTIHGAKEMEDILNNNNIYSDWISPGMFVYKDFSDGTFKDRNVSVEYVPLSSVKSTAMEKNSSQNKFEVRKCHIRRLTETSFGFYVKPSDSGVVFISEINMKSRVNPTGLKVGDRIIEVNGINVEELAFSEVVNLIQRSDREIKLLVVDKNCDNYCKDNGLAISSSMVGNDSVSVKNVYDNTYATIVKIRNLPATATEETILDLFEDKRTVDRIIPPWESYKGLAYVLFKSRESAIEAAKQLDGSKFESKTLQVQAVVEAINKLRDNHILHVGNLPYNATETDIADLLRDEAENIQINLNKNKFNHDYNIGEGFLHCGDIATINRVAKKLDGYVFKGRKLFVDSNYNFSEITDKQTADMSKDTRPVMAYIVQFKPTAKQSVLKKLGIKQGPLLDRILDGETHMIRGVKLTPKDILADEEPVRPMLVVDCPSEDYLDSLLTANQFSALNDNPATVPQLIVHFTPSHIADDPRYQQFIQRFHSEDTHHLMLNDKSPALVSPWFVQQSLAMNQIHPDIFPVLHYEHIDTLQMGNITQGVGNLQYFIKPRSKSGFSWNHIQNIDTEKLLMDHFQQLPHIDEAKEVLQTVHHKCRDIENTSENVKEYPVITFLGTGAAGFTKYRNVTCILVETSKDEFIMFDCGHGSLNQLYLMFGEKRAEEIMSNLKAVFVSHLHRDHIEGILSIALKRYEALEKQNKFDKLLLIAPAKIKKWLNVLSRHICNTDRLFETIPLVFVQAIKEKSFDQKTYNRIREVLNLKQVITVQVESFSGSFGVWLRHADDWTMMYSGDTRPSEFLVSIGKDKTDYLIHEATHSNSHKHHAFQRNHSTIEQAVSKGRKMNAKHIILTHLSKRYMRHPVFTNLEDGVAYAYDFMQLKPKHIPMVTHFKPALTLLFNDGYVNENMKYRADLVGRLQGDDQSVR